jgi:hypothetical protein
VIVRRVLLSVAVVALLGVAAVAVATAPDSGRITEPFYTTGSMGETVKTRLLTVSVDDVTFARQIVVANGGRFGEPDPSYSSEGVWVVVDVTAMTSTDSLILSGSLLTVGDLSYSPFSLPSPTIESFTVGSDVPVAGTLVFELPMSVYESPSVARLILKGNFSMPLEEIPVVDIPLAGGTIERSIIVEAAAVAGVDR